jgi:hypothetical protein
MAAIAFRQREGHRTVAQATLFSMQNLVHGQGAGSSLHFKQAFMAICTV